MWWLFHQAAGTTAENLGAFVELEVTMPMDQERKTGETIARRAMQGLGFSSDQLVERAYIDLLEEQT